MSGTPSNSEAFLHRIHNQRRIAFILLSRSREFLKPGVPFSSELSKELKKQGNFGSKDRKLYRELIFTYIRYKAWMDGLWSQKEELLDALIVLATPTQQIQSLYPSLSTREHRDAKETHRHRILGYQDKQLTELLPDWFTAHLSTQLTDTQLCTLFQRPPLWLRVQNGNASEHQKNCQDAKKESDPDCKLIAELPDAIECPADLSLTQIPAYANGSLEVQDISSQILLHLMPEAPQGHWFDACAGAGGKTLQLAKMLGKNGKVTAFDLRQSALRELDVRKKRARLPNIQIATSVPSTERFDGVLVDSPCSGTGTWRRHPFLKEQTDEKSVMDFSKRQLSILKEYARLVAPGGTLAYSTCSLSHFENEHVVDAFLRSEGDVFEHSPIPTKFGLKDKGHGITVYPHHFNGDGLFIAVFKRSN